MSRAMPIFLPGRPVADASQVPLRVDIEVAHLDQVHSGFANKPAEHFQFVFFIGQPRQYQVVDGSKSTVSFMSWMERFRSANSYPRGR